MAQAKERVLTLDDVVAALTRTLGREKSHEAVSSAAQALGRFDADAVLEHLAADPGVVGVAARLVRSGKPSVVFSAIPDPLPDPRSARRAVPTPVQPSASPLPKDTIPRHAVTELLASSLGEDAAGELVNAALQKLGIDRERLTMPEALRLLETLAVMPGLVGITARFAKARTIFLFRGPAPG